MYLASRLAKQLLIIMFAKISIASHGGGFCFRKVFLFVGFKGLMNFRFLPILQISRK